MDEVEVELAGAAWGKGYGLSSSVAMLSKGLGVIEGEGNRALKRVEPLWWLRGSDRQRQGCK